MEQEDLATEWKDLESGKDKNREDSRAQEEYNSELDKPDHRN